MKATDRPSLSERLDRFFRWFLTASPTQAVALPPLEPKARSRTVSHRQRPQLRPRHSGPVRVAVKGKP